MRRCVVQVAVGVCGLVEYCGGQFFSCEGDGDIQEIDCVRDCVCEFDGWVEGLDKADEIQKFWFG